MPPETQSVIAQDAEPGQEQQQTQGATEQAQSGDPFQLDEAVLATLSPEQRQTIEPMIAQWKTKAQETIKGETDKVTKKYQGYDEAVKKAQAFDTLRGDQRFQQWYQQLSQGNPQQQQQAQTNILQAVGSSNEEYALAVQEAAGGDPTRMNHLNMKIQQAWAQPLVSRIADQYNRLQTQMDVDGLFKRHPDAEKFNSIIEPKSGLSLLEAAAQLIVDGKRGSWEDAYDFARKMYESARSESQQEALGMIQSKKDSVTEGASKQTKDSMTTIEVDSPERALKELVRAGMAGRTNVNYVSKRRMSAK
jgi:hypothetical protein